MRLDDRAPYHDSGGRLPGSVQNTLELVKQSHQRLKRLEKTEGLVRKRGIRQRARKNDAACGNGTGRR